MEIILSHQITVIANFLKYPLCSEIASLKLQYLLDPLLDVVTECINKGAEILLSHSSNIWIMYFSTADFVLKPYVFIFLLCI